MGYRWKRYFVLLLYVRGYLIVLVLSDMEHERLTNRFISFYGALDSNGACRYTFFWWRFHLSTVGIYSYLLFQLQSSLHKTFMYLLILMRGYRWPCNQNVFHTVQFTVLINKLNVLLLCIRSNIFCSPTKYFTHVKLYISRNNTWETI